MAIVQSKFGTKSSDSVDHILVFDSSPTQGNLLVAFIHHRNTVDCSDIVLSGWTEIACGVSLAVGKGFFKVAGALESSTVTITTNGRSASGVMTIFELDDIDTDDPVDSSVVDTGSSGTSLTIGDVVTTADIVQMICFMGVRQGGDTGSFSFTNSFTKQHDGESTGAGEVSGGGVAYRRVIVTGTYNTTASWTDAGNRVGILVAFKELAAGERRRVAFGSGKAMRR